jgi:4a-hydroxytetrahydrobiopterin dehydratase
MKPSLAPKGVSPTKARNATLMNLLATPGLGSLIAGRWLEGAGQLLIFLAGFVLFCLWAINNLAQYYRLISASMTTGDAPPPDVGWNRMATLSIVLCLAGWLWSLVTSLSLLREASETKVQSLKLFAAGETKLDETKIPSVLAALPNWKRAGEIISRTFEFPDFVAAMKFVNAVAELAEQAGHHPDIDVRWNKVTLALTTHDAGGLTEKDFALAKHCDGLVPR